MNGLNGARATRLAGRATRRRRDGTRGVLARWAWSRLTAAADRGSQPAIDAVWRAWLRDPGDEPAAG
jgi:hypothetical protein